tara:strand:- start:255 stop:482 length:228 start_codon:yes stop_codon:yes gene_type:complete
MGYGMKLNIDETNTIIQALEELKGLQGMPSDKIDALLERFNTSLKLKMIDLRIEIEIAQHDADWERIRLHNEDML